MTPPPLIWLPDGVDQLEHAVIDTDVLSASAAGVGDVLAVCSASVRLCSLATPAFGRCPDCAARVRRDDAPDRDPGFRARLLAPRGRTHRPVADAGGRG